MQGGCTDAGPETVFWACMCHFGMHLVRRMPGTGDTAGHGHTARTRAQGCRMPGAGDAVEGDAVEGDAAGDTVEG